MWPVMVRAAQTKRCCVHDSAKVCWCHMSRLSIQSCVSLVPAVLFHVKSLNYIHKWLYVEPATHNAGIWHLADWQRNILDLRCLTSSVYW